MRLATVLSLLLMADVIRAADNDWPVHGADNAGTRYSALDQITRNNVAALEPAWSYRSGEMQRRGDAFALSMEQNIPILAAGKLIVCTPFNRIIALDPASGEEIWFFDPEIALDFEAPANYGCRSIAQWVDETADTDKVCRRRLVFGSNDLRIFAIDAVTGQRCPGFGDNGEVQTTLEKPQSYAGEVRYLMPPGIINDIAVFGSASSDYGRAYGIGGKVRAFDVRTGRLAWEFQPRPSDPATSAAQTWQGDRALESGGANVWGNIAVDAGRDLVYVPTASPTADTYGGHRGGSNLYSSSLLALRGSTGELVWHYQIVHHDLWGWDVAPQPLLIDLRLGDNVIPAVVQNTKQGLIFVLNRETGEPIFPIEEQPVPKGDVPGEWYSPTQPIPSRPPPLIKTEFTPEDVWGLTFYDRNQCKKQIAALDHGHMYAPPSLRGTLMNPWSGGGPNWGGPAYDPKRQLMIVNSSRILAALRLVPLAAADNEDHHYSPTARSLSPMDGTPYAVEKYFVTSPFGAPCSPPPWGALTAVNLETGSIEWEIALGSIERMLPVPLPIEWGVPNVGGPIVTGGGLVFIAATFDQKFRAFDIDSGEKLWQVKLPAGSQTAPMTYMADGRQFVVITSGGHADIGNTRGDYTLAYALPQND